MGYSGLPSALWHIGFGWFDIVMDIASILATHGLARRTKVTCEVDFPTYFLVCFYIQLGLLVGNQVTQMILAAIEAAKAATPGQPNRARTICSAMFRGATNCQLAYLELTKHKNPTPQHVMTVLHHKMGELVWEAPQVIMSWSVILIRMFYEEVEELQGAEQISSLTRTVQVLKASSGLVFLSIAATDFIRFHPLSAWATSKPPQKLFIGLIDISPTWGISLLTGLYTFVNLLDRSFLYMLAVQCTLTIYTTGYSYITVFVLGASMVWPLLLLLGFGSWTVLPATAISYFINIPWVTGRTKAFRVGRFSSWPSWVMQLSYLVGTVMLCTLAYPWRGDAAIFVKTPRTTAIILCKYKGDESGYWQDTREQKFSLTYTLLVFVAPMCTLVVDLALFIALAGWQSDRRRRYLRKHAGVGPEQMVHDLDIGIDQLPSATYAWKGLVAVRQDHPELF